jgi:hypothetical protein
LTSQRGGLGGSTLPVVAALALLFLATGGVLMLRVRRRAAARRPGSARASG